MKIRDLETGYVVELRTGEPFKVLKNFNGEGKTLGFSYLDSYNKTLSLDCWNEDLKYLANEDLDIMKVFKGHPIYNNGVGDLIWERKEVDWSKVKVNTPIWVKQTEQMSWEPAHFAEYTDGKVYAYYDGKTSHTARATMPWKFARLAEDQNEIK